MFLKYCRLCGYSASGVGRSGVLCVPQRARTFHPSGNPSLVYWMFHVIRCLMLVIVQGTNPYKNNEVSYKKCEIGAWRNLCITPMQPLVKDDPVSFNRYCLCMTFSELHRELYNNLYRNLPNVFTVIIF